MTIGGILGSIYVFPYVQPYVFAPDGFAFCDGQRMPVNNYRKLFNLIGYTYGGSGDYFLLPKLINGITGVGSGTSASGKQYTLGLPGGNNEVVLDSTNTPPHVHTFTAALKANKNTTNSTDPTNRYPGNRTIATEKYYMPNATAGKFMADASVPTITLKPVGASMPINVQSPYLALAYCICIEGEDPEFDS